MTIIFYRCIHTTGIASRKILDVIDTTDWIKDIVTVTVSITGCHKFNVPCRLVAMR